MVDHEFDYSEDWRIYPDADGNILLPDLWDPKFHRIIMDCEGTWELCWLSNADQRLTGTLASFDTLDEAIHAAVGAPVNLTDQSSTAHPYLTMTVRPQSCDPDAFVILVRQCGGPFAWEALVNTRERWPKHAYGDTYQEALSHLFGVEALDGDDPMYAFMETV
jgi:hypothetical protein